MAKFRKKPVVIEAERFIKSVMPLPFTAKGDPVEFGCDCGINACCSVCNEFYIQTLEGKMIVNYGDWVIKGIKGEFYPCKPDIFEATYEPA